MYYGEYLAQCRRSDPPLIILIKQRKEKQMEQNKLGKKIGVTNAVSLYYDLEAGQNQSLGIDMWIIIQLCSLYLHVHVINKCS